MTAADGAIVGMAKVLDHGPAATRWNVVILGDGYRAPELPKYRADVTAFIDYFYGVAPFNALWPAINVYRVDVTSTDSGADDPGACADGTLGTGAMPATYFDATFCSGGATRRLLSGNSAVALAVASAQVPEVHVTLCLVNTPAYGGAGGPVAWFSTAADAAEIGIHELAHTFFGLEDEYDDVKNVYAGPEPVAPNVTANTNRNSTKWAADILPATPLPTTNNPNCAAQDLRPSPVQVGTVGLFEGGGRSHCGLFRPEYNCRMRTLGRPFCSICQQRIRAMLAPFGDTMTWQTRGNKNVNPATDFLGTADAQPLIFRTDNAERARFSAQGNAGFGTANPLFRLHVAASGGFVGGEDANGVSNGGNVPLVAQSDSTAVGILNAQGRPAFALNIDGNQGQPNARGVPTLYDRYDGNWHQCLSLRNGAVGVGTGNPLFRLHAVAPGNFGNEDGAGAALSGGVPIVAQSDGTAFGVLNAQGRPAFALNIDGNQGQPNARGVPTLYDRYDGNWHRSLSLRNGQVGLGTYDPQYACEIRGTATDRAALAVFSSGEFSSLGGVKLSGDGFGVSGESYGAGSGVVGVANGTGSGVQGQTAGTTTTSIGVVGFIGEGLTPPSLALPGGVGVLGHSPTGTGVGGSTNGGGTVGNGVEGFFAGPGTGAAVHAKSVSAGAVAVYGEAGTAGYFIGDVAVQGTIAASAKAFRMDHPLDPENKFLSHASVESPDMMTVYTGDVVTDESGFAEVILPDYFEALNQDVRYQLTVLQQFAQAIVEREVAENRFVIRTDKPNVRVCWQVTGVRQDPYARARRIQVEHEKSDEERGRYLHPDLYRTADMQPRAPIGRLPHLLNTTSPPSDGRPPAPLVGGPHRPTAAGPGGTSAQHSESS
ncbi:M64 family metallopeptidase [Streptomyces sp. NPDC008240]|uniref:M64 family metallopeptidase n=1 Tax=Streptomyces sp. NPDC008240 TaxID=3364822 RepID=UPI0036E68928